MRKSEVYGDPSQFLFGQAVRVRAREGFDQCAFAVIHMACRGQNEMMNVGHDPYLPRI